MSSLTDFTDAWGLEPRTAVAVAYWLVAEDGRQWQLRNVAAADDHWPRSDGRHPAPSGGGKSPPECLELTPGHGWTIRDLGSKNGTRVDDQTIDERAVRDGAHVACGNERFSFHALPAGAMPMPLRYGE